MHVKWERNRRIAKFLHSLVRVKSPRQAELEHVFAKGADI